MTPAAAQPTWQKQLQTQANAFWAALTQPHASITMRDDQRRARLTAALSFILMFTYGPALPSIGIELVSLLALTSFIGAYFVARSRWYNVAPILIIVGNLVLFTDRIVKVPDWSNEILLVYLVFVYPPLLIAAVVMRPRWFLVLAVAHVPPFIMLYTTLAPSLGQTDRGSSIASFILTLTLLILGTFIQEYYFVRPQLAEVEQARKALQARNQSLEDANREVRNFSYIVAHDLRAPLVTISEFSKEIAMDIETLRPIFASNKDALPTEAAQQISQSLDHSLPEAVEFVGASATRLNYMIDELLKLARAGQRNFSFERVPLGEVVAQALATYQITIANEQVAVTLGTLPTVTGDRLALQQMIGNLIDNAIKYRKAQGPHSLAIQAQDNGDHTMISVVDNGRGIQATDHEKVFQLFRRAGNTADVGGAGLGLSYVQALVQRHGGRIWFTSVLGQGSTFFISLPHEIPTSTDSHANGASKATAATATATT
jgi:signal transduction histidine kinase